MDAMNSVKHNLLTAPAVSGLMEADITSRAQEILFDRGGHGSITIEWTGTSPVGTVYVRGSNDDVAGQGDIVNWTNIPGLAFALTGNSGVQDFILSAIALSYRWLDVFYDFTSGTGTLSRISLILKE